LIENYQTGRCFPEVDVLVNNLGIAPLGKTKVERLRRRHRGFVADDLAERLLSFSREWNERIPAAGRRSQYRLRQ
jgi:NAD(P)-dependent dehydrogenase (short-subunit alcohol dehydrogenase family)